MSDVSDATLNYAKSLIPALIAASKDDPSPESMQKIFNTALEWAKVADTLTRKPEYKMFIL